MWLRRAIAVAVIVVGLLWFFQGIGVIHGSFMTGEALWAVIGAICVGVGAVVLLRRPRRV